MKYMEPHYVKLSPKASPSLVSFYGTETRFKVIGIDFLYGDLQAICVLPNKNIVLMKYPENLVYDGPADEVNDALEEMDRLISLLNAQQEELNEQKERINKLEGYLTKASNGNSKSKSSGTASGKAGSGEEQATDVTQLTESEGTNV